MPERADVVTYRVIDPAIVRPLIARYIHGEPPAAVPALLEETLPATLDVRDRRAVRAYVCTTLLGLERAPGPLCQLPPAEAGGLSLMRSTQRHRHLDVWLVESSPSISHRSLSDVDRRDRVSKSTEPACSTGEPRLTRAIGLLAVPTGGTGAARVARVHEDDRDTSKARLVRDERPQLIEGPGVQCCPVAAPNGYPLPNPLEVFQRDSATCALSLGNDLLADDMVGVRGESAFFARQVLQPPLGALGALPLELGAQPSVSVADVLQVPTAMDGAITGHRDVGDPHVYAKELLSVGRGRLFHIAGRKQVKATIAVDQIGLAMLGGQQCTRPVPTGEGQADTPAKHLQGHGHVTLSVRDDLVVIGDRPVRREGAQTLPVQLVGVGHLADGADGEVGREAEAVSDIGVDQSLQGILAERTGLPRHPTDEVAGRIDPLQRGEQLLMLVGVREQGDASNQLHTWSIAYVH
jgi:hypothetical protein